MSLGIGNITAMLESRGFADNTIIALTADNGGQNGVGGNNYPLRGSYPIAIAIIDIVFCASLQI